MPPGGVPWSDKLVTGETLWGSIPPASAPYGCFMTLNRIRRPTPKRDVAHRWTEKLAKFSWTPISDVFLNRYSSLQPPIKHGEAMFIIHLLQHKWDDASPYPSFRTVAKKMGVSHEAARNYARSLESKGYLTRVITLGETNRFNLKPLFHALELAQAEASVDEAKKAIAASTPRKGTKVFVSN